MKLCVRCNKEKDISLFVKKRKICKECLFVYQKNYHEKNKALLVEKAKIYNEKNRASKKKYNENYYKNNTEIIKKKQKAYRKLNKKQIRKYNNEYEKNKRASNPLFRIRKDISRLILRALKDNSGSKDNKSILDYMPYSIQELKEHIEKQFESWMTWENHGKYEIEFWDDNNPKTWTWHIDHIIPQSSLPFSSMEDDNFKKCWALDNLRPLKSIDNMKKGSSITEGS